MHARILIAIAALAVAGCGSSAASQPAAQKSNVQTVEQSGGGSQSSSNQTNSGGNTNSTTQSSSGTSSSTQSSGSVSQQTASAGGATLNSFTGTGGATIRITLATASRVLWSNTQASRFTLHSDDGSVSIDSTAGSGEARLPAGSHRLQVGGSVWTLLVRPN
jgi:hypothetical protein